MTIPCCVTCFWWKMRRTWGVCWRVKLHKQGFSAPYIEGRRAVHGELPLVTPAEFCCVFWKDLANHHLRVRMVVEDPRSKQREEGT